MDSLSGGKFTSSDNVWMEGLTMFHAGGGSILDGCPKATGRATEAVAT